MSTLPNSVIAEHPPDAMWVAWGWTNSPERYGYAETVIAAVRDWCLKNGVTWPEDE